MIEKKCRISGERFEITKEDLEFYAKMEVITQTDLENLLSGKIIDCAGLPTMCPEERIYKLMTFRNERILYQRKCDFSQKEIVSAYSSTAVFPVYENSIWWSDKWDALSFGKKFDFSESFFNQFKKLFNKVPQLGVSIINSENSHFNSHSSDCKNCYLNALLIKSEDCYYCYWGANNQDVVDSLNITHTTLAYESIDCHKCYEIMWCQESKNCNNCYFSFQIESCKNCIGCWNLKNKEYFIFNKKVSPEEFLLYKQKILNGSFQNTVFGKNFLKKIKLENYHRFLNNLNCEDVLGNHLRNSKNCKDCFDGMKGENCFNSISFNQAIDMHDCYAGAVPDGELLYSNCVGKKNNSVAFSFYTIGCLNLFYSSNCHNCQNCFGCVGLRQKKHCILNKQYTKEEYEELVPKIIEHMKKTGEWGEFFPTSISPFGYNETVAQEYFPLTKEEAEKRGYKWKEETQSVQYTGPKYEIPDDIKDVTDEILEKVLQCERSRKFYRIQKAELKFYRKMNLPIPRLHPDERHKDRMALRNPRKLWKRNCGDCECELQTTFAPDRPEKILCEECYLKIVD